MRRAASVHTGTYLCRAPRPLLPIVSLPPRGRRTSGGTSHATAPHEAVRAAPGSPPPRTARASPSAPHVARLGRLHTITHEPQRTRATVPLPRVRPNRTRWCAVGREQVQYCRGSVKDRSSPCRRAGPKAATCARRGASGGQWSRSRNDWHARRVISSGERFRPPRRSMADECAGMMDARAVWNRASAVPGSQGRRASQRGGRDSWIEPELRRHTAIRTRSGRLRGRDRRGRRQGRMHSRRSRQRTYSRPTHSPRYTCPRRPRPISRRHPTAPKREPAAARFLRTARSHTCRSLARRWKDLRRS